MNELPAEFGFGDVTGRGWWMSSNGEIYGLKGKSHPEWAERYLTFVNRSVSSFPVDKMFRDGWIRLLLLPYTSETSILSYQYYYNRPSSTTLKRIKDFALEHGIKIIMDSKEGRYYPLDEGFRRLSLRFLLKEMLKKTTVSMIFQNMLERMDLA